MSHGHVKTGPRKGQQERWVGWAQPSTSSGDTEFPRRCMEKGPVFPSTPHTDSDPRHPGPRCKSESRPGPALTLLGRGRLPLQPA